MSKKRGFIKYIVIAVVLAGVIYGVSVGTSKVKSILNKLNPFKTETTVDETGIAVEALNEIGEIITAQYYGETYCSGKANGHKDGIVYLGRGVVTSGLDLHTLQKNHFTFNKETRTVRISYVGIEIIDSIINPWFIPGKLEGFQLFHSQKKYEKFSTIQKVKMACISNLKTDAIRMDIKLHALNNAEMTLGHLVGLVTDGDYENVVLSKQNYFDLKYEALTTDDIVDEFEFGGLIKFLAKWSHDFDQNRYVSMEDQQDSLRSFCEKVSTLDFVIDTDTEPIEAKREKAQIDSLLNIILKQKNKTTDSTSHTTSSNSNSDQNIHPNHNNQVLGIDISKFQGNEIESLNLGDAQLDFVICKATEGVTYTDSMFLENWKTLAQESVIRGAYHFYRTQDSPKKQVNHYLEVVGELGNETFSPIIDFEEKSIDGNPRARDVEKDLLKAFDLLEKKTGRKPILYSDLNTANKYCTDSKWSEYPIWIAEYRDTNKPELPKVWSDQEWTLWQRSDSYSIEQTKNDLDIFNGSKNELENFIMSLKIN